MNIKKCISIIFLPLLLLLIFSCSNKKNNKAHNSFLAYYNTFYSAKINFDNAIEIISKNNDSQSKLAATTINLLDK